MKRCPKCGCEEFYVTAHVIQDWLVDCNGDYINTVEDCIEVAHSPADDDMWTCKKCGYEAEGNEFDVKNKIVMLDKIEVDMGQIRVPVHGGYLVAERNPDPNYDGISVMFETDEKDIIDIVLIESPNDTERKVTNIYTYEDVYQEDYTSKYVIKHDDINKALFGE